MFIIKLLIRNTTNGIYDWDFYVLVSNNNNKGDDNVDDNGVNIQIRDNGTGDVTAGKPRIVNNKVTQPGVTSVARPFT